ncbi:hypothetical protein GS966_11225 [Rhodococcus hoagii]|nr:hypothetical protein [Prescottella equi]
MQRSDVDPLIEALAETRQMDAWLQAEHMATRELLTEQALNLRAVCETQPHLKEYVSARLKALTQSHG